MRWHLDERVCIDERRQLLDECENLLKAQGHELLLEVLVREIFIHTSVWLYVCMQLPYEEGNSPSEWPDTPDTLF